MLVQFMISTNQHCFSQVYIWLNVNIEIHFILSIGFPRFIISFSGMTQTIVHKHIVF